MIETTPNAIRHLRELLEQKGAPQGHGLRLAVEKGGCAGWQYAMQIAPPQAGDAILDPAPDVRVIVAADALPLLQGARLDYHEALNDAGFKIENPNAARTCGCGTSFETQT